MLRADSFMNLNSFLDRVLDCVVQGYCTDVYITKYQFIER